MTLWCLGEFGELLISGQAKGPDDAPIQVTEKEVVGLINKVLALPNIHENIQEYGLNCLIKLYPKYLQTSKQIQMIITKYTTSRSMEVQQRACEYLQLLEMDEDIRGVVLVRIPIFEGESVKEKL